MGIAMATKEYIKALIIVDGEEILRLNEKGEGCVSKALAQVHDALLSIKPTPMPKTAIKRSGVH